MSSAAIPSIGNSTVNSIGSDKVIDRDTRYKQILIKQLGKNGINLFVSYSFIMVVLIILVIFTVVGLEDANGHCRIVKFIRPVLTEAVV
jgi:uncharacterized Tic20 family protein